MADLTNSNALPDDHSLIPPNAGGCIEPAQLILFDHHRIKDLFDTLDDIDDGETRRTIAQQLIQELKIHCALEEEFIYPRLKQLEAFRNLTIRALEEHHVVNLLLFELDLIPVDNPVFNAKLAVMRDEVEHHIKEEETELLPLISSWDDIDSLAERIAKRKVELADALQAVSIIKLREPTPSVQGITEAKTTADLKRRGRKAKRSAGRQKKSRRKKK